MALEKDLFEVLLDMIHIACHTGTSIVSEKDYHRVVGCIRAMDSNRQNEVLTEDEILALKSRGWDKNNYNPFRKPIEHIRFGLVFGPEDNPKIEIAIKQFHRALSAK